MSKVQSGRVRRMRSKKADIAVVGMSCRFPDACDYNQFWNNLEKGVDSVREIPLDRWDVKNSYAMDMDKPTQSISKWCGLLNHVYDFDHQFFKISPREAIHMDPQQRLILEETWHCIEDSGISLATLQHKQTAIYAGVMTTDYRQEMIDVDHGIDSYACLGNFESLLSNRISYTFDFRGASQTINAACASSLVAVHEAKQALRIRKCDYALVACVNLNLHPWKYISFSKSRMLSPDGICRAFDLHANGYVPGDGVAVLLLQRLDEAVKDHNHIYGIIKGSDVNHSGKSQSITAPRVQAQQDVIKGAYQDADLRPEMVNYVEAHGTGTSLGDPIELESLTRAFRQFTDKKQFCKIGSVKTNIGHLESAAGLAGIIKVLMMMKHRKIPKTLHLNTLNPIVDWDNSPFIPANDLSSWESVEEGDSLRASVSSFGFGGVNSHVLLEEYQSAETDKLFHTNRSEFFVLSAKTTQALDNLQEIWKTFVTTDDFKAQSLSDISSVLLMGREAFQYRCGILVRHKEELKEKILADDLPQMKAVKCSWELNITNLAWEGYADIEPLYVECSLFKQVIDDAMKRLRSLHLGRKISSSFFQESWTGVEKSLYQLISGYAFAFSLISLGLTPSVVTGHNDGWWVAMAISGILKLEDILTIKIGKSELKDLEFSCPAIPLREPVTGEICVPLQCNEAYIHDLISLTESGVEEQSGPPASKSPNDYGLQTYIQKSKLLYPVQHTFKGYIDDWESVIQKETSCSIVGILCEEQLLNKENITPNLLLIVLVSSLRKLYRKWNLEEQQFVIGSRLEEIMDLLDEGVLPKETLVQIMLQTNTVERAVEIINNNLMKIHSDRKYPLMKKYYQNEIKIEMNLEWISLIENVDHVLLQQAELEVVYIDNCDTVADSGIHFGGASDVITQFYQSIFQLWMKGVPIHWNQLFQGRSYHKIGLPVYSFDRNTFRINETKEQPLVNDTFELEDLKLKQLLLSLEKGELEIDDIKREMGDAWCQTINSQ
ncbi:type I polyketide synthase [Paenibacillus polymyxa]|uniref:type I polyketide synthase n=1 Tax=Paenibacillus polymyxa TaxID=1406 RepID=UPI000D9F8FE3|nr:polyketide synthase [Paenibacillus polymyxa]MEE4576444.1 beta-ketoacyl synthase N-terminal-like domain-containing protein [Paenibacillus polymyxa]SPY16678.1 putative polyketide synthase pksM [Paenibacillus polymyxa]